VRDFRRRDSIGVVGDQAQQKHAVDAQEVLREFFYCIAVVGRVGRRRSLVDETQVVLDETDAIARRYRPDEPDDKTAIYILIAFQI